MDSQTAKKITVVFAIGAVLGIAYKKVTKALSLRKPPIPKQIPHAVTICDKTYFDPYYWMRDDTRSDPEIISLLEHENSYTEWMTKHTQPAQKALYDEILSHLQEDDADVPYPWHDYVYYHRTEKGQNYPIFCRKRTIPGKDPLETDAKEEIILNVNQMAEGHKFFDLGRWRPSPDHTLVAYAFDVSGYETYEIRIKDLKTGKDLPDRISNVYGSMEWGLDNKTLYYSTMDDAHRPNRLHRHVMGTDTSKDVLIFEENDDEYRCHFERSTSGRFLFVSSDGAITTQVQFIDLSIPDSKLTVIEPKRHNVLYYVDHSGDYFWIVTNDNALNFKLVRAPINHPSKENWITVLAHSKERYLTACWAFEKHLVIPGRRKGLTSVEIIDLPEKIEDDHVFEPQQLSFAEDLYTAELGVNRVFNLQQLRLDYSSMVSPRQIIDYDLKTQKRIVRKEKFVPKYTKSLYNSERLFATANDGTQIPISIVYRRDKFQEDWKSGSDVKRVNKVLLYGYGAYGYSYDPEFNYQHIPLLDRGVVVAIAHIRGGSEMGRYWYETGKFLDKKNTFTDFINVAEHLVKIGFTTPKDLAISGGSAGGLLMGAVANMRPDLFCALFTRVPFVDVMVTMSDPSIPLTAGEWKEWGDPRTEKYHEYMRSYSPIENVKAQNYPPMLVTTSLNDSRVAYWEPMKWVSTLRAKKTDSNAILLKCKMGAGHGGASARYEEIQDKAFIYTWVLEKLGLLKS